MLGQLVIVPLKHFAKAVILLEQGQSEMVPF